MWQSSNRFVTIATNQTHIHEEIKLVKFQVAVQSRCILLPSSYTENNVTLGFFVAVPPHAMQALGGREGIAPTQSRH
jgi:hypothetical protein